MKSFSDKIKSCLADTKISMTRVSGYIQIGNFAVNICTFVAVSTALNQWWIVLPVGVSLVFSVLRIGQAEVKAGVLKREQEIYFDNVPQILKMMKQLDRIEAHLTSQRPDER